MLLRSRLAIGLRHLRRQQGLTQQALADLAGLDLRNYQRIEAGMVSAQIDTVDALARALGVDVVELLAEPVSPER